MMIARRTALAVAAAFSLLAASNVGAAERPWLEVKSPHFTLYSDAGEKEARRVAIRFEQVRRALGELWGPGTRLDPGRPVAIYAMRDAGSLRELLPEEDRSRVGGLFTESLDQHLIMLQTDYKPPDQVPGYRQSIPPNEFLLPQHEYVHALMNLNFERVSPAINEGLAEFWGNLVVRDDQAVMGLLIPHHLWVLDEWPLVPLGTLLTLDRDGFYSTDDGTRRVHYAESWAFVHYLVTTPGGDGRAKLDQYLRLLKAGAPQGDALKQAFGDLAKLTDDFRKPRIYQQLFYKGAFAPKDIQVDVRSLAAAESEALRGQALARMGETTRARRRLEAALKLDAKSAAAHEGLAIVGFVDQHWGDMVAASEKAIAIEPSRMLPHFLAGLGLLRDDRSAPADVDRAIAHLDAALARRTDFAPSYGWVAEAMTRLGGDAAKALPLARRAVTLDPSVVPYRLLVARLLKQQGDTAAARAEAEKALSWATSVEDRRAAREFLESLAGN